MSAYSGYASPANYGGGGPGAIDALMATAAGGGNLNALLAKYGVTNAGSAWQNGTMPAMMGGQYNGTSNPVSGDGSPPLYQTTPAGGTVYAPGSIVRGPTNNYNHEGAPTGVNMNAGTVTTGAGTGPRTPPAFSLAPAPAPWQQNEAALGQLSYDQLYPKIMAQYGNMLNLAGQGEAFQQNQNNMLTGQQTGQMTDQLLAEGLGNSTVLPSMVNNAQSLGALRGENIAANAAQQKLGVYGQQAQAMQQLPAPLAPGAYGTGASAATVPNMAKTLFGPSAATNPGQQVNAQQNQQGAFQASGQMPQTYSNGSVRFW